MKKACPIFFLVFAISVACNHELLPVPGSEGGLIPLNIDGSIRQVQTKATAQGFVDKDAVGLFAVNYSENNTVAGTLLSEGNQADNVKYVFDEPGQKWVPARSVYYKDVNTHADLYLYYPYQGSISDVNAANFEVQKDQNRAAGIASLSGYEASDWMWGKGENVTPSESKVRITLSHRLSAVQLTLEEGSGFSEGEFASLEKGAILMGTTRKAQLDYATGGVTPVGEAQLDGIVMCPQDNGSWRAVVVPQTVAVGVKLFLVTLAGVSYSFSQTEPVEYQQGKQMNVTLTLNKKSPAGDYEITMGTTQIRDWTEDRNSHGGEARQYYVVNLATAGTLQSVIQTAGKNPAKIRNLKITGIVNADDFYFMRDQMSILEAVNMKECEVLGGTIPERAFQNKQSLVYYVFPEDITEIGNQAFSDTWLSGPLILPDSVTRIGGSAFSGTLISSIQFPAELTEIGTWTFNNCHSLSGALLLPDKLVSIGEYAFNGCEHFSGHLRLPDSLEQIGWNSFYNCGSFTGDLVIPDRITVIPPGAFGMTTFTGGLYLNNVQQISGNAFMSSGFSGELTIPEGVIEIEDSSFSGTNFTTVHFPSSLRVISQLAFGGCGRLTEHIVFPEGLITIKESAFESCRNILGITLPASLNTIQKNAFQGCYYISSIICNAVEPPTVISGAFDGVAKDNFTVEVPAQSVIRYQSDPGWNDFKRISAHYDFSISRTLMQEQNAASSRTLLLRAPSGFDWSIQSKPDWVTVTPASGSGKTDVTITVSAMPRTTDTFEVNEGTFNNPIYKNYKGRSGEVVFLLDGKDYTTTLAIEQYDSNYADGSVQVLQTHSKGNGIDVVFVGDGYSARDLSKGVFLDHATEGYGHFFDVEPYKTYKDYFNVYAVTCQSEESGVGTVNTIIDNKFGSTFSQSRIRLEDPDAVFAWARKADVSMDFSKSLVILLQNTSMYEGVTLMYGDGSALACCPVSRDAYPYDFRGIIQHEAGGHGFGKLADEYIYHNAFIQNCPCGDSGCEHPQGDDDSGTKYGKFKALGWYKNLSMLSDPGQVPWAHLFYNPQYSDYVDVFEGAYMHSRGIYRSEMTSCMNNNIPYYSAISRQAIVERIKNCAGESFSLEDFYANDKADFGPITKGAPVDRPFGVDPKYNRSSENHGPILMGEHPNVQ